jgi:hypothetical protein
MHHHGLVMRNGDKMRGNWNTPMLYLISIGAIAGHSGVLFVTELGRKLHERQEQVDLERWDNANERLKMLTRIKP